MSRPIYKLGEDAYIEWSSVVDAPASPVLTYAEAYQRFGPERMLRVEMNGHSYADVDEAYTPERLVRFNRAGPFEECLTLEAILRRYAPSAQEEPLTPADIQPIWTNGFTENGASEDEQGPIYVWQPWRPGEAPEEMPDPDIYHELQVRIGADELAELTRTPAEAAP